MRNYKKMCKETRSALNECWVTKKQAEVYWRKMIPNHPLSELSNLEIRHNGYKKNDEFYRIGDFSDKLNEAEFIYMKDNLTLYGTQFRG